MTLAKRLTAIEGDNLTPQQAVILWMREAHEFGSWAAYARWLLDQPDEAYPLIRMPRQVVDAVRSRNKGVKDELLRDQFLSVQKDVLFLYHLHKEVEMWAAMEKEAAHLLGVILIKDLHALMLEKRAVEDMHLARVRQGGERLRRPGKAEKEARARYEARAASWVPDMDTLLARVLTFLSAADRVSRTYFAGEDVLYPATREYLQELVSSIANMKQLYDDAILELEEVDERLRERLLAAVTGQGTPRKSPAAAGAEPALPDVSAAARVMAGHWITSAKCAALEKLGERYQAEELSAGLLREGLGG
jgi:hypothetical protein